MLELVEVKKSFGPRVAVDGVSLSVKTGEVFGLLGPNGAGKSTTIGMCIGVLRPDAGSVRVGAGGLSPERPEVRRQLGVAPQSLAVYDELTGRENLAYFGTLQGLSGADLRERVARTLESVGLSDRANDRVAGYSGGMKRRLNLAAALVHGPGLVLLDEPTAGVDPQSRNSILDMVRRLASGGTTVLYTTHYMEEAEKVCDRVGIIDNGRLLALGTVDELVGRFGGESVVRIRRAAGRGESDADGAGSGVTTIRTAQPIRELERELATGTVASVTIDRPDLEAVFLSLTGRSLRD